MKRGTIVALIVVCAAAVIGIQLAREAIDMDNKALERMSEAKAKPVTVAEACKILLDRGEVLTAYQVNECYNAGVPVIGE